MQKFKQKLQSKMMTFLLLVCVSLLNAQEPPSSLFFQQYSALMNFYSALGVSP